MNALFARMRASDRNFVHDFQGAGFHARLFELCCFAYLEACAFQVDRSQPYPDFMARWRDNVVAVEAVTSNPADGEDRNVSAARMTPLTEEEVCEKASTEFPRRVLRGLTRKLRRKYHEHSHVAGHPLVFMVAPFHESGASFYVEDSLLPALFPLEPNPPEVPFFEREGSEDVSAIAFCNAFTVSKLWRMADPEFIAETFIAERSGHAFFEGSDKLHGFRYRVGHELTPRETWLRA